MSWGMIAVGAGTVISGAMSASSASGAAEDAANANIANTNATNAANLAQFNYSRGGINPSTGYGNAILPQYFGQDEQNSALAAYQQFQNMNQANSYITPQLQAQLGQLNPALNSSLNTIGGAFNGQNLNQQLGFAQPVYGANLGLAQTTGQGLQNTAAANTNAINSGLAQTLAQLNSSNAANGFLGNSSFNSNRMLSATVGAQQQAAVGSAQAQAQAAQLMGTAHLQNVQNTQGLQSANLQGMMNTSLIGQGLGGYAQAMNMPQTNASNNALTAQSMLNFYKLQPQAFQFAPMPTQTPGIGTGQIIGGALGAGISAGASQYNQNQMMSLLNNNTNQLNPNAYNSAFGTTGAATMAGYGGSGLTAFGAQPSPYGAPASTGFGGASMAGTGGSQLTAW